MICVGGTIGNHNRPSSSISCTDGKASVASMSPTAARTEALRKLLTVGENVRNMAFREEKMNLEMMGEMKWKTSGKQS